MMMMSFQFDHFAPYLVLRRCGVLNSNTDHESASNHLDIEILRHILTCAGSCLITMPVTVPTHLPPARALQWLAGRRWNDGKVQFVVQHVKAVSPRARTGELSCAPRHARRSSHCAPCTERGPPAVSGHQLHQAARIFS